MKPLMILIRIILVGIFWSIFFFEGIRVILLTNWHFDILRQSHWLYAWNLWLSGWVIDDAKEWAFVLIILSFIPLWLTGWAALSMIKYGKFIEFMLYLPLKVFNLLFGKQVKKIAETASVKLVKKKKSYKEIRPKSIRAPVEESSYINSSPSASATKGSFSAGSPHRATSSVKPAAPVEVKPKEFDHSLFNIDDGSDFDFDLFDDSMMAAPTATKPEPTKSPKPAASVAKKEPKQAETASSKPAAARPISNSTLEVIKQKGYEVITAATIKNTLIDFIGVSEKQICLCLTDKEPGDWLADEERFNDEEPLWFSESSHRISPVRKIDVARSFLKDKLTENGLEYTIDAYVIEQIGNIINAEDMFEIWNELNIKVTRIDRGTPKEINLFAKTLEEASGKISKDNFEKIKKLIRSIA